MNPQPFFSWHMDLGNALTLVIIGGPLIYGLVSILTVIRDYVPHKHIEKSGTLDVDGISYPRSMKNGRR